MSILEIIYPVQRINVCACILPKNRTTGRRPLAAAVGFYAFSTSKKSLVAVSACVRDSNGINKPLKLV